MTDEPAAAEAPPAADRPADRTYAALTWILAVAAGGVAFGIMLRVPPVLCPNDQSRWNTVWSLVERGSYVTDEAPWAGTIDKVRRDGHEYSSKIALLPTLLAGEYWLIKQVTGWTVKDGRPQKGPGWSIKDQTDRVCRAIMFTVNIIPLIVYIVLIGRLIGRYVEHPWWRVYWLAAAAFGTYVTGYSLTLNDHSVGAWSCLFALYSAVAILYEGRGHWWHFALCGFFTAFTACNQLPAALFALPLFVWLLVRDWKRTLLYFVPATALPVVGFLVTTYISTGGGFVPYYLMKQTELYQYEGSYWATPVGIDALHEPKHIYVLNLLLGHHGFFTLSPIFLLSAVSFVYALRDRAMPQRGLVWFVLGVSLATMALNTATTNNYGGVCQGFRYLIWPVPLWILIGALKADVYGKPRWVMGLALLLLLVSAVSVGCCTDNPWTESWLADWFKKVGWAGY